MIIYRVENEAGDGFYRGGRMRTHLDAYDEDHPGPAEDKPIAKFYSPLDGFDSLCWGDIRFGFRSMCQLEQWVLPHWRSELARRGQHIALYEVAEEAVILGDRQLIFDMGEATKVGTASLVEIGVQLELEIA